MPEIAEVRIMSDFINKISDGKVYQKMRKSTSSKVKTKMKIPVDTFTITSESRGKELKLILKGKESTEELIITLGMSGYWAYTKTGNERTHSHLMFDTINDRTLSLVDVRRFAKWRWDSWNEGRGPDPIDSPIEFKNNIISNIEHNHFLKPIGEVLLNQKYFNGIGNYLRAEILYKSNQDPFQPAIDSIKKNPGIIDKAIQLSKEAYLLGGGELKNWQNPLDVSKLDQNWMLCYGNKKMVREKDSSGRTLWYDPKWKRGENEC